MDGLGWIIATAHTLLGHDKAALVMGVDTGDKSQCLICAYEQDPTPERKRAVEQALSPKITDQVTDRLNNITLPEQHDD